MRKVRIKLHLENDRKLTSNCHVPTFPDGMDVEIFSFNSLEEAWKKSKSKDDREHVTPYIKRKYSINILKNNKDYSHIRITLDEYNDLKLITKIINYFKPNINFSFKNIINTDTFYIIYFSDFRDRYIFICNFNLMKFCFINIIR